MKKARKILVGLLAMVMVLGMCMTVQASATNVSAKSISVAKNVTIYTNSDEDQTVKVSFKWDKKEGYVPVGLTAATSDRGVVKVVGFADTNIEASVSKNGKTATAETTLVLNPIANGKAKITISDKMNSKVKKVVTVTVKTLAEDITFNEEVVSSVSGNDYYARISSTKNSSINLGAMISNADASNKKISYKVEAAQNGGTTNTGIKVDSKGNVKVTASTPSKVKETVVTVKSTDKNTKAVEYVTIKPVDSKIDKLTVDTKTINLKGNKASDAYTYQLEWAEGYDAKDLTFTSSKASVASVDKNGLIAAKGNGTAKITISPKLGNASKAVKKTVTVNVTTDVEYVKVAQDKFTILANKKATAKIGAATNPNASNKKVTYKIEGIKDADGNDVASNQWSQYITLDKKKGTVKAKKECTATVYAYAKADESVFRGVTVKATVPVNTIAIATENDSDAIANSNKTAFTVYKTGEADVEQQTLDLVANVTSDQKVGKEPTNGSVDWKSSKTSVATVDNNGVVTAVGNGKTTITAIAKDGSGKKKSVNVTVKVDAYDINIKKAQTGVDEYDVVYVEDNKNDTYTLTKAIAAATNTNASNKKVAYYDASGKAIKNVKLTADDANGQLITIKAADGRTHGVKDATANPVTQTVRLVSVSADKIAESFTVEGMPEDGTKLLMGETWSGELSVEAADGKTVIDKNAVTLVSSAKKVVAVNKNGTLTAKKEGTATITAKVNGKEVGEAVTIYVGRKTADVEKVVESSINNTLKAENRDYTGVKTAFNAKKNAFTLEIINPTKDFTQLEDTGIIVALENIIKENAPVLSYKTIELSNDTESWKAVIDETYTNADVFYNDTEVLSDAGIADAVKYMLEETTKGANELKDWNGRNYTLDLTMADAREHATFEHVLSYSVATTMKASAYDEVVDAAIAKQINMFEVDGLSFAYDAANNGVEIYVTEPKTIEEADDASREVSVEVMKAIFADAKKVTLSATVNGENQTVTKENVDVSDEFINELLDEYVGRFALLGVETLDNLEGSVMAADVTFEVGTQTYAYTYETRIFLDEAVYDARIDAEIAAAIKENKDAFAYGKLIYNKDTNVLKLDVNGEYYDNSVISLATADLDSILAAIISNSSAEAVTVNGTTEITLSEDTNADAKAILKALYSDLGEDVVTLRDLDGKTATIEVVYPSVNETSKRILVYTIEYSAFEYADENLVWQDEFNGTELNRDDWNVELHEPGWVNAEWQEYVDSEENIYVKDGNLVIQPIKTVDENGDAYYTSGRVNTMGKHDFKYGRFEAKLKVPTGMGYLPAFWMMPTDESFYGQWPKCGEIDIMEVMGQSTDTLHGTIHYGESSEDHKQSQGTYTLEDGNFADEYHVFAVEWEPGEIRWYVDDVLYHTENDWYTRKPGYDSVAYPAPFDQPFYMIFNVAVGGSWVGYPDDTTTFDEKAQLVVDYVRVYQKDEYDENVERPEAEDVPDSEIGENLIVNGEFSVNEDLSEAEAWQFLTANGGAGNASITDGELKIESTSAGTVEYGVQLVQAALPLKQGNKYRVSFDAWADEDRTIIYDISAPDNGWIRYVPDTKINLTTETQSFSKEIEMTSASDANARFELNLGNQGSTATVYVDNVRVEKIDEFELPEEEKTVLPDGNYVYNGSFDIGDEDRMDYWTVATNLKGANVSVNSSRVLEAVVPSFATSLSQVKLIQDDLALLPNAAYKLTFNASADAEKTVQVKVADQTFDVQLSTDMTEYNFDLTTGAEPFDASIQFLLGAAGTTYIDDVRIADAGLFVNGDFANNYVGYERFADSSIASSVSWAIDELDNGNGTSAAAVTIENTGDQAWKVQLKQNNVKLEKDQWYRLSLDARSTMDRQIMFAIQRDGSKHNDDWTPYSGEKIVDITGEYGTYSIEFPMNQETDAESVFSLSMGAVSGTQITDKHTIFIDNITLEKIDGKSVEPLAAGTELIKNGEFANGAESWTAFVNAPAVGNVDLSNGSAVYTIDSVGKNSWDIQLCQNDLQLDSGADYQVTFDIKSSVDREFKYSLLDPKNGYAYYGGETVALKADEVKNVKYTFTANNKTSESIQFQVALSPDPEWGPTLADLIESQVKHTIEIDNVSVRKLPIPDTDEGTEDGSGEGTDDGSGEGTEDGSGEEPGEGSDEDGETEESGSGNLITNGDFAKGQEGWTTVINAGGDAKGTEDYSAGYASISFTNIGSKNWHAQLAQKGLKVENGKKYVVSFKIKSTVDRKVKWDFMNDGNTSVPEIPDENKWSTWYGGKILDLKANEEKIVTTTIDNAISAASNANAMLQFTFAPDTGDYADPMGDLDNTTPHTITIDDVSIVLAE